MEHLSPRHQRVLEDKYFLQKSVAEMSREYGCTERAVRGMLERARRNLVRAFAEHGKDVVRVPQEEL